MSRESKREDEPTHPELVQSLNEYAETVKTMTKAYQAVANLLFSEMSSANPVLSLALMPTEIQEAWAKLEESMVQALLQLGLLRQPLRASEWEGADARSQVMGELQLARERLMLVHQRVNQLNDQLGTYQLLNSLSE